MPERYNLDSDISKCCMGVDKGYVPTCKATCTGCTPSSEAIHSSVVWNTRGRDTRYGTFSFFRASTALGASCRAGPPTNANLHCHPKLQQGHDFLALKGKYWGQKADAIPLKGKSKTVGNDECMRDCCADVWIHFCLLFCTMLYPR
jgi:hypothetical protein